MLSAAEVATDVDGLLIGDRTVRTVDDVVPLIDVSEAQTLIIAYGPGRTGSTALMALFASHPRVDHAHFQPIKSLIRIGGRVRFRGTSFFKETFGPFSSRERFDPVDAVHRAGFAGDVRSVALIAHPCSTYRSASRFSHGVDATDLLEDYLWTAKLAERHGSFRLRYEDSYALLPELFQWCGLPWRGFVYGRGVRSKLVLHQARHPSITGSLVDPVLRRGRFEVVDRGVGDAPDVLTEALSVWGSFG